MSVPDPFERELMARELAEDPEARAARLASQHWITQLRLWAAMEREGITEPGDQARFICARLWPDLPTSLVDDLVAAVRRNAAEGELLRPPARPRDVIGERLEQLMIEHGYSVQAG